MMLRLVLALLAFLAPAAVLSAPQIVLRDDIGFGLEGISDWTAEQPFLDLMKTARPWIGHLPDQWGGWDHQRLRAEGFLDENGWLKALPAEVTGVSTLVLTDLPEGAADTAGRYELRWDGRGALSVEGRVSRLDLRPTLARFDFTPGEGMVVLTIRKTDPADPIRNLRLVREDRRALLESGEIFNPDFLARIEGARSIRFMDWMATNDATLVEAADRPRIDDYAWTVKGVPVEVMVELANRIKADPWFTMPHTGSDGLAREYAAIVARDLDPALRAHVEFSNEIWNWQFQQAQWADDHAQERWGIRDAWVQYGAVRAAEVAAIWTEEFGDSAPERLVRVIATQTGWLGLEDDILNAPRARQVERTLRPPVESFDAYAVTGYFGHGFGSEEFRPVWQQWLAEAGGDMAAAFPQAAQALLEDPRTDSLDRLLTEILPHHRKVAEQYGLKLLMYEGGTHVVGQGPVVDDEQATGFFLALNYSDEMAGLYRRLIDGWAELGDGPFMAFVDVSAPSKWGSWGALRHLSDDNPRWQALRRAADE